MIPLDLVDSRNWVVWRLVTRNDKPTKIPFDPKAALTPQDAPAKANDPATWSDLRTAEAAMVTRRFAGLGFVFAEDGELFGVDLDGCLHEGELAGWAEDILEQFPTYAEVSPSGSGVKLFGRGTFAGRGRRKEMPGEPVGGRAPGIEVYGRGRFFCVTGKRWPGAPLEVRNCQLALAGLLATYWPVTAPPVLRIRRESGKDAVARARTYLARSPGAVSGQRGHDRTYRVACVLVRDIGLPADEAYALLSEWNQTCQPPWSEAELWRKVHEAQKAPPMVAS